nr:RuBisCO long chain, Form III-b [uncultured archaeon]
MKYIDYVDLEYSPEKDDLICEFLVDALGMDMNTAAGAIAAESSIGTWAETTTTRPHVEKLRARVFSIEGDVAKIAYPIELFEGGNMPNILSSVAGNVFGLKELQNLRLNDITIPKKLAKSFDGPEFGIDGIRKITHVKKRCMIGTIVKPKLGLNVKEHAKISYDAWIGGCDIVKDDENLSSQDFNRFEDRIRQTLRMRDKAEKLTGERKMYMANVTAETGEMIKRAKFVKKLGGEYVMVDVLTAGFSALQSIREADLGMVLHAHRAMHAALTKNPKHGISMGVLSRLLRIVGVDQLHAGTAVGKMSETESEVRENIDALKSELYGIKTVMPVASGGLWAGSVPDIIRIFGNDVIIQAGGGIHGIGTRNGAMSMRQAADAAMEGVTLDDYSKSHKELRMAMEKWKR